MTTFNTELGQFRYTVMPVGATIARDVFQHKLDQCFGHIKNIIVIADDIMVVQKQQNHRDHDQVLTTCLKLLGSVMSGLTTTSCSIKKKKLTFLGRPIPPMVASQLKAKSKQSLKCQLQLAKSKCNLSLK